MDKIYGIVILYNPDIGQTAVNINRYLPHIDRLMIWANSPIEDKDAFTGSLSDPDKIDLIQSDENAGIPKPLNEAIKTAREGGYDYLLTMDQDSTWQNLPVYLEKARELRAKDSSVMITGPSIVESVDGKLPDGFDAPTGIRYDSYIITSGALYDLKLFDEAGTFPEIYFIDAVDEEICLRAASHGYKYALICDGIMLHNFGKRSEHRLLGKTVVTHDYSAVRYYYTVRNHMWLIRCRRVPFGHKMKLLKLHVITSFARIVLFEDNKKTKFSSAFRGLREGLSNKYRTEWEKC